MNIAQLLFGVDAGLLVLTWMIQTVVYPSFLYLDAGEFKGWHRIYTRSITRIVFPLMSAQLAMASFAAWKLGGSYWVHGVLVILTWVLTVVVFMPRHSSIQADPTREKMLDLIKWNWVRTALWTATVIISAWAIF
jgi:hypothetical protein